MIKEVVGIETSLIKIQTMVETTITIQVELSEVVEIMVVVEVEV
jgi:hypothetical protein